MFKYLSQLFNTPEPENEEVSEHTRRLLANIHYVREKKTDKFVPWTLIQEDDLPLLVKDKQIVVQLLQDGKTIMYAGITKINTTITIKTTQRDIPQQERKKAHPVTNKYNELYLKVELTPISTTRLIKTEMPILHSTEPKIIYIRPNIVFTIEMRNPYVSFDVYDDKLKPLKNIRAIVSFKTKMERWMVNDLKKYNKKPTKTTTLRLRTKSQQVPKSSGSPRKLTF